MNRENGFLHDLLRQKKNGSRVWFYGEMENIRRILLHESSDFLCEKKGSPWAGEKREGGGRGENFDSVAACDERVAQVHGVSAPAVFTAQAVCNEEDVHEANRIFTMVAIPLSASANRIFFPSARLRGA